MNLSTRVERETAFKETYSSHVGLLKPNAGIAKTGFIVCTFDPETQYAQLRNKDYGRHNAEGHAEYYEFVPTPDSGTVTRERFYFTDFRRALYLDMAGIGYNLRGGLSVKWSFNYHGGQPESPDAVPLFLPILEIRQQAENGEVCVGECWYSDQEQFPTRVDITGRPLREVALTIFINRFERGHWGNKDGDSLNTFRLGPADLGKELNRPNMQGSIKVQTEDRFMRVVRYRQPDQSPLVLVAPRLDLRNVDTRIRGSWSGFAAFPSVYPVEYIYFMTPL